MLIKTYSDLSCFQQRREQLYDKVENSVFILFSGVEGHLDYFRPQSSFIYLTGFEEPESVAVIRTGAQKQFTLFVRPKDPSVEVWDGERYGPEKARQVFGADQCFSSEELSERLPELMQGADRIYFALGDDVASDELVLQARDRAQMMPRRSGQPKMSLHDPNEVLASMRMIKDASEITYIKEVCELSAQAHVHVMKSIKPGLNERQSLGHFLSSIYNDKASREAYSSIIASGDNACTLHYRSNCRDMSDGDFMLIDAGAEKHYYKADITRTYPVNGRFTGAQKKIYQAVLDVQKDLIAMVKVGYSLPELHEKSCELLTEKMIGLGLLSGTVEDNLKNKTFHKYYPHGVGHYLGLDVHDVGFSKVKDKPVPFQTGTLITIEPGIYVPSDDTSAPEELRGLGVRIEDDILVTTTGPEVLTASAPKEINELEALIGCLKD